MQSPPHSAGALLFAPPILPSSLAVGPSLARSERGVPRLRYAHPRSRQLSPAPKSNRCMQLSERLDLGQQARTSFFFWLEAYNPILPYHWAMLSVIGDLLS